MKDGAAPQTEVAVAWREAGLLALLSSFSPWTSEAHEAQLRIAELLRRTGPVADPFSRTSFSPGHFTASAFVLSPDSEGLLLIFHKKLRLWLQPGGHIEAHDADSVHAARREIEEETGLTQCDALCALADIDVHEIPPLGAEPQHLHFDLRSLFRARDGALAPGHEVSAARWFPLAEVAHHLQDTDESVRRAARVLMASRGTSPAH